MKVEVTMENIIRYRLVELTKNSSETMMHAARLAEVEGDKLTCEVPDYWMEKLLKIEEENGVQSANTFEMFGDGSAADTATHSDDSPLQSGIDDFAERLKQRVKENFPGAIIVGTPDIVQGEVVEDVRVIENARLHSINFDPNGLGFIETVDVDPMSTSHIPFPPDMVDEDDEE